MSRLMKKKGWNINGKALIGIIVFTLLINTSMCISGSLIFDKAVQKIFNERGYVVANIILQQIDHDKIAEYANTWEEDDYYEKMRDYLVYIQECSDAAYIYIAVPREDKTIKYIYDSGSYIGYEDPVAAPFDEIWDAYTKGERPKSYLVRHSQYGYLTSSCLPIKDSKDNVVALLFVDTNMEVIHSVLFSFITNMIIIAVILLAAYCLLNWYYLRKNLINPIMIMISHVRNFANNTNLEDDSLKSIRTNDELQELAESVSIMEKDIVEYIDNIQKITAEKERISAELNVATKIQADMLPRKFPAFPERKDFDIFASMTPAKEVGGDFYDFFLIDDDHIALVMADVSGKGVPAALFMVNAKTLIKNRALMGGELSPSKILEDVNNQLCEGNDADLFVTVWLAIIELSTGKGVSSNAGHEHPAIRRRDEDFQLNVYKHSPALGIMEGIKISQQEFQIYPGDDIFVYTDGVAEATNSENELYGPDRLIKVLNRDSGADAKTLLSNVQNDIEAFVKEAPQFDDITMLCFRYFGKQ